MLVHCREESGGNVFQRENGRRQLFFERSAERLSKEILVNSGGQERLYLKCEQSDHQ